MSNHKTFVKQAFAALAITLFICVPARAMDLCDLAIARDKDVKAFKRSYASVKKGLSPTPLKRTIDYLVESYDEGTEETNDAHMALQSGALLAQADNQTDFMLLRLLNQENPNIITDYLSGVLMWRGTLVTQDQRVGARRLFRAAAAGYVHALKFMKVDYAGFKGALGAELRHSEIALMNLNQWSSKPEVGLKNYLEDSYMDRLFKFETCSNPAWLHIPTTRSSFVKAMLRMSKGDRKQNRTFYNAVQKQLVPMLYRHVLGLEQAVVADNYAERERIDARNKATWTALDSLATATVWGAANTMGSWLSSQSFPTYNDQIQPMFWLIGGSAVYKGVQALCYFPWSAWSMAGRQTYVDRGDCWRSGQRQIAMGYCAQSRAGCYRAFCKRPQEVEGRDSAAMLTAIKDEAAMFALYLMLDHSMHSGALGAHSVVHDINIVTETLADRPLNASRSIALDLIGRYNMHRAA